MRLARILAVVVAVAGCTSPDTVATTQAGTSPTTTTSATAAPPAKACSNPGEFFEGGTPSFVGSAQSDAGIIGLIEWADRGSGCEEFTIVFQSAEGAPATTTPLVAAEFLDQLTILRLRLDTPVSVVADQAVETALVEHLYVVSALSGRTFIDFHLTGPASVRVTARDAPARLVVELLPGIIPVNARPILAERLVVIRPLDGSLSTSPVVVTGYARGFDDGVLVIATAGTTTLHEQSVPTAETTTGWAEFRATISSPSGPILIFVGEDPPGPGLLSGVVIPITVR